MENTFTKGYGYISGYSNVVSYGSRNSNPSRGPRTVAQPLSKQSSPVYVKNRGNNAFSSAENNGVTKSFLREPDTGSRVKRLSDGVPTQPQADHSGWVPTFDPYGRKSDLLREASKEAVNSTGGTNNRGDSDSTVKKLLLNGFVLPDEYKDLQGPFVVSDSEDENLQALESDFPIDTKDVQGKSNTEDIPQKSKHPESDLATASTPKRTRPSKRGQWDHFVNRDVAQVPATQIVLPNNNNNPHDPFVLPDRRDENLPELNEIEVAHDKNQMQRVSTTDSEPRVLNRPLVHAGDVGTIPYYEEVIAAVVVEASYEVDGAVPAPPAVLHPEMPVPPLQSKPILPTSDIASGQEKDTQDTQLYDSYAALPKDRAGLYHHRSDRDGGKFAPVTRGADGSYEEVEGVANKVNVFSPNVVEITASIPQLKSLAAVSGERRGEQGRFDGLIYTVTGSGEWLREGKFGDAAQAIDPRSLSSR